MHFLSEFWYIYPSSAPFFSVIPLPLCQLLWAERVIRHANRDLDLYSQRIAELIMQCVFLLARFSGIGLHVTNIMQLAVSYKLYLLNTFPSKTFLFYFMFYFFFANQPNVDPLSTMDRCDWMNLECSHSVYFSIAVLVWYKREFCAISLHSIQLVLCECPLDITDRQCV